MTILKLDRPARLTLLGEPRLVGPSGKVIRLSPKAYGLAAAIALDPSRAVSRSQVAELLWGPTDRRFGNLRKLLWAAKTSLREHRLDLFVSTGDTITLDQASIEVDVSLLQTQLEADHPIDLTQVSSLYTGDLLDALPVYGPEFLDWLAVQRAKLRNAFLTLMSDKLSGTGPEPAEPTRLAAARRVLEIDPYNESACRALMLLHARQGESAQVNDLFRVMTQRLADDLGTTPSAATTRLFRDLMAEGAQEIGGDTSPPVEPRPGLPASHFPTLTLLRPTDVGPADAAAIGFEILQDLEMSLARSKLLRVVAAVPTWRLEMAGHEATWPTAYGIAYAIVSTVTRTDAQTQFQVRLVEIAGRAVIWAERLLLDGHDPDGCREKVASLTMSIINQIERTELAGSSKPEDRTPYHWYLAGRYCLRTMDLPSIRRGRRHFRIALDLDPDFIPAVVGSARALQPEWLLLARGDTDILAHSEDLARRAIRLDPEHAVAHRVLAFALLGRRSYPASAEAYAFSERLNPLHPDTLAEHGIMLTQTSQLETARTKIHLAFRLNPAPPDYYYWGLAWNQYLSGQNAETIETLGVMQNPSTAYRLIASAYARLGNRAMAARYVAKVMEIHPDFTIARWVPLIALRDRVYIDYYVEGLRLAGFS